MNVVYIEKINHALSWYYYSTPITCDGSSTKIRYGTVVYHDEILPHLTYELYRKGYH